MAKNTHDILATMGRERPPDFADRLPRVVPKEEPDISELSDEMADLLYPGRRPRPFRIGLRFDRFDGPGLDPALALARQSPVYSEEAGRNGVSYHAAFDASAARTLLGLFEIVKERPDLEVRVDGKKLPYAHELWLPLFWMFVGGEA
jgi:hypothetical protein